MAGILNFPSTPSDGQIYQVANLTYQYNATYQYWAFVSSVWNSVFALNPQIDNYTLGANDVGRIVSMNAATDKTITIPANATVSFAKGTTIEFLRLGVGNVTIAITTDTLRAPNSSFRLAFQNSGATVVKTDWTEWDLVGDLKV